MSDRWPIIEKQAASVYPVIHERVLWLYIRYLEHMKQHGQYIYINSIFIRRINKKIINLNENSCEFWEDI